MRIAFLTYSTKPRGSVIHTIELAEALHQLGHDVCIHALDKDGQGFGRSLTCRYQPVPAQPAPADIDQLIQQRIHEFVSFLGNGYFQAQPYDLYHAQDCISANALLELRQAGVIPHFVRTIHHIEDYNSPYLQDCQDRSIREPDLRLCISQYWQTELQRQYGIHAPRVNNGVNTQRFSATPNGDESRLRQQLGLTGQPIYLTVGGIEPRKNSLVLLEAFTRVLEQLPQAQLVIAGGATLFDYQDYRDEFFRTVSQNRIALDKSLVLPGVILDEDLPTLYRLADAFVFPSIKEGWGLVVLEAIASGLPVLTANQPPFTEFLAPQQAILVNPHDVSALTQAMLAIAQPQTAQSLIQGSREVCDRYSWQASAQMHLTHYETLQRLL